MNIGNCCAMHGKIITEALSVVVAQFHHYYTRSMEDIDKNIDQILAYMEQAAAGFPGLDLFVTPESSVQGESEDWPNRLLDIDGPQVQRLKDKCKALRIWGIFNPWIKPKSGAFAENTAILVNDQGEIVHKHVKVNTYIPAEVSTPGKEINVADGPKGSKIGIIICADGDYPETWREAAYKGANVIVRISHYMHPWDKAMEITDKAGAYCNQVYVVSCNAAGIEEHYSFFGKSAIYNPDGTEITKAAEGIPCLIKADLYPGIIDHMRKQAVHSNPMFTFRNRGASCPDYNGRGDTTMPYTAYK